MANQDNKFIKIESSYSYIGGDKSQQGLQEYLSKSEDQIHSLSANINLQVKEEGVNFMGELSLSNETNPN